MPKVDWLITEMNITGGAESFVRYTAPRVRKAGWDLRVITFIPGGELLQELKKEGVPVIELGLRSKIDFRVVLGLRKLWGETRPDLVHTHLFHAGIMGRLVAHWMGIRPVIVHQHGAEQARTNLRTWTDRFTTGSVTCYVVTCQAVADILAFRERIEASRIKIIYNGLEIQNVSELNLPTDWPVSSAIPVIGCVGRLSLEKGQDILIQAMGKLNENGIQAHLVLLGEGQARTTLENQVNELNLSGQVHLLGARRDIPAWLSHFQIFTLPSRWEGISMALLEAMAAGVPVIATHVGGTPEVIRDHESGILVPPGEPAALAEALQHLLTDADLRHRLSEGARQRVREYFSIDRTVLQIDQLYKGLLNPGG